MTANSLFQYRIFRFLNDVFSAPVHIARAGKGRSLLFLLVGLFCLALQTGTDLYAQGAEGDGDLLLDATWVPCGDSTESMYVFRDGTAIYAWADRGIMFTLGETILGNVVEAISGVKSVVDTTALDSCTTVGVILDGPRYLLLNFAEPAPATEALHKQLNVLRDYARRRIDRDIERSRAQIERRPNPGVKTDPALDPDTLQQYIYESPIAARWRCRGTVIVTAQVDARGNVRRAFAAEADVKGKCSSLLVMTAIRAVMLSSFEPAIKIEGTAGSAWMNIVVTFGRKSVTTKEKAIEG